MKYFITFLFISFGLILPAQKNEKLRVGEKIPFTKVVLYNQDNNLVNMDLPNTKSTNDRFVLVYFFSADKSAKEIVAYNSEVERILNKYQNNACKGASEIEYATVCVNQDFNKWKSLLEETNLHKSKFSGKKYNYLAKDGVKDKAVTAFKVSKYPTLFLVNPKGRLYLETDSFEVLEKTFQNICKVNVAYSTSDISGKILSGEKVKAPVTDLEVFLIKNSLDTINKTVTDGYGDFYFKKIDTTQNLSVRISQNDKVKNMAKVYLAKQSGAIVAEFKKGNNGFEYRLLQTDVVRLSQVDDDGDDITMKYKKFEKTKDKNISISENIYYQSGKYDLLLESELILDKVIVILNANPNVKLEVISHTDSQGDDASNLRLSENRSTAVIFYLVNKGGIDKSRLKALGKGETEIRNRCANGVSCSDKEHEYNRRTEFKFMKN